MVLESEGNGKAAPGSPDGSLVQARPSPDSDVATPTHTVSKTLGVSLKMELGGTASQSQPPSRTGADDPDLLRERMDSMSTTNRLRNRSVVKPVELPPAVIAPDSSRSAEFADEDWDAP